MSSTTGDDRRALARCARIGAAAALAAALACVGAAAQSPDAKESANMTVPNATPAADSLSVQQQAILPIAAFAAAGDIGRLDSALNQGLDAGLAISAAREILVQLYAYAGFPRSLNALSELMKVVDARKQRGIQDEPGSAPSRPIPKGDALLAT